MAEIENIKCDRCESKPDLELCGSIEDIEARINDIMQCPFCKSVSVWH